MHHEGKGLSSRDLNDQLFDAAIMDEGVAAQVLGGGQPRPSSWRLYWRRLLKRPAALVGTVIFCFFLFLAVFGPWIAPYDHEEQSAELRLSKPTPSHPFGADQFGRDILSRVIVGTRNIFLIGGLGTLIAVLIGTAIGLASGYVGGTIDEVVMRLLDVLLSFPSLLLALVLLSTAGPSNRNIILVVAILPFLGVGGRQLFRAEVPGPVKDKLTPRIIETARTLWMIYVLFSFCEFVLLLAGGMSIFDALCHTFTTMATGGFSTKDAGIAHFNSAYIDTVVTVFMALAGINFTLHYGLITGNLRTFFKDPELRFYAGVVLAATAVVFVDLRFHVFQAAGEAFRYAVFQVVSIITTTGFATANFDQWPTLSRVVLILLMFIGGSQGSTGGGIKCIRMLLILKHSYRELYRLVHPHAHIRIKLGPGIIPPETMQGVWGFFALYLGLAVLATLLMSSLGLDMLTAFSSVAATIGNVGPGMGLVHPATTYADIPYAGKWILSFCMLAGRLEIYTVLVLLVPEFWKK